MADTKTQYADDHFYESYGGSSTAAVGGFTGQGSRGSVFAKPLGKPAEQVPGRFGSLMRGEYVIVVKCECSPTYPQEADNDGFGFCNCHVAIFWKDAAGLLHRDCEEMFKSDIGHVLEELIPFCGGSYSDFADALGTPPATDLARGIVDLRVTDLASIDMLQSELWSAVRIFLEAAAASVEPTTVDLPKCITRFMQQSVAGRVVRLAADGEPAAQAAVAALGGHWPPGCSQPSLQW